MPIRVLIAGDHEISRMGVRVILAGDDRWEVCGEARDGAETVEKVEELAPDVVILDLTMPVMDGVSTADHIRRIAPITRIVLFSMHEIPTIARLAGGDAFVSKSAAAHELPRTIMELFGRDHPAQRSS